MSPVRSLWRFELVLQRVVTCLLVRFGSEQLTANITSKLTAQQRACGLQACVTCCHSAISHEQAAVHAGPHAAQRILDIARQEFPMNKSLHLLAAQDEVEFWQAVRQGRGRVARARAAAICSLPHHTGAVEMDVRCACAVVCSVRS